MNDFLITLSSTAYDILNNDSAFADMYDPENAYVPPSNFCYAEEDLDQFDYIGIKMEHLLQSPIGEPADSTHAVDLSQFVSSIEGVINGGYFWDNSPEECLVNAQAAAISFSIDNRPSPKYESEEQLAQLWQEFLNLPQNNMDIFSTDSDNFVAGHNFEIKLPFTMMNRQEEIVLEANIPHKLWKQLAWQEEFTLKNLLAFSQSINLNKLKLNYHNGHLQLEIPEEKFFKSHKR